MYRYAGVVHLFLNAVSAELGNFGTGALDLWVADVQGGFPSIMEVAHCFKTTVITTSESAGLPGAAARYEYRSSPLQHWTKQRTLAEKDSPPCNRKLRAEKGQKLSRPHPLPCR